MKHTVVLAHEATENLKREVRTGLVLSLHWLTIAVFSIHIFAVYDSIIESTIVKSIYLDSL